MTPQSIGGVHADVRILVTQLLDESVNLRIGGVLCPGRASDKCTNQEKCALSQGVAANECSQRQHGCPSETIPRFLAPELDIQRRPSSLSVSGSGGWYKC
jgi:hypothetical protein